MRSSFGLRLVVLAGLSGLVGGQGSAPTVFAKLARGSAFPKLEVQSRAGEKHVLRLTPTPTVIAFLRPDQVDSVNMLRDLAELALDMKTSASRIVVVGSPEREKGQWSHLWKGAPRRLELFLDEGPARRKIGVTVMPSLAVVDREGRLRASYVLHDTKLRIRLQRDLMALQTNKPLASDEITARERRYAEISASALRLERLGKFSEAYRLRTELKVLELHPADVARDLGRLSLLQGRGEEAVTHYKRSLELQTGPAARLGLGRALLATGRLDAAGKALRSALVDNANPAPVHRALCDLAKKRGDLDTALAEIKAAIAKVTTKTSRSK